MIPKFRELTPIEIEYEAKLKELHNTHRDEIEVLIKRHLDELDALNKLYKDKLPKNSIL